MLFSYFPPSFVLIFAREPIAATSITQAPFRFSTSLRPSRCIAVRHPCFDFATEGENTFSTPMKANTQHDEGRRSTSLTLRTQATAIHRAATLRTAHNVRAPTRVPTSLRGGNTLFNTSKPKTSTSKGAHHGDSHKTITRYSQVVSIAG